MANPIYHQEPEFYERPGETVHLEVDQHPSQFRMPGLPWRDGPSAVVLIGESSRRGLAPHPCEVCGRTAHGARVCDYCARAQARDETFRARANQPQPSRPRIAVKEGWEAWSESQTPTSDPDLESGHVRPYETRIG